MQNYSGSGDSTAIYAQFGDSQNSIKSSNNAIKIDPSDAEAYSNMVLILFQ